MNKIEELREKKNKLSIRNVEGAVEKIHAKGKLTAEERLASFYDRSEYVELTPFRRGRCTDFGMDKKDLRNEGVICAYGEVDDRTVFAYAHDGSVMGGSAGEGGKDKMEFLLYKAIDAGAPVVSINDAPGARIQEGVAGLDSYCCLFGNITKASGWIPQISIISGRCAGGTSYASALTDFIIQIDGVGEMFITGPKVIKQVTGEDTTFEAIGSARVHAMTTGLTHFIAKDEQEAFEIARRLLSFLPSNSMELPPLRSTNDPLDRETEELNTLIPEEPTKSYDMKDVIRAVADDGDFMEVHEHFAKNMIVGFMRMGGETVGAVANQPKTLAGCIDVNASFKAARFVRFCDAFNIPILTFADTPGYLPGVAQENMGIIRNGAKMLCAYSEATVPKITLIIRKDYGGAYSAMCGKGMGADFVFSVPTGELAIMGPEGAAEIVYKKEISQAEDKEAARAEKIEEYKKTFLNPYKGAEYGIVDDVIEPKELRKRVISALRLIRNKKGQTPFKKHTNIPL